MTKYLCWNEDESCIEEAKEVECPWQPDDAAEKFSEEWDRHWCEYPGVRTVGVTVPDADKKEGEVWPKFYEVYLESSPVYIAYEKKDK